jgi:hypothetical protein
MTDNTAGQREPSAPSRGSVVEAERPLGDPEIAIELLKLRVKELEGRKVRLPKLDPNAAPGVERCDWCRARGVD